MTAEKLDSARRRATLFAPTARNPLFSHNHTPPCWLRQTEIPTPPPASAHLSLSLWDPLLAPPGVGSMLFDLFISVTRTPTESAAKCTPTGRWSKAHQRTLRVLCEKAISHLQHSEKPHMLWRSFCTNICSPTAV